MTKSASGRGRTPVGRRAVQIAGLLLGLVPPAAPARAQTPDAAPAPSRLKRLSVEELSQVEVETVSRRPEKLSETASAIQVVSEEEIRRSGAGSLPEALRLATNLQVAQVDSRQWAITARGFNSTSANKLLVMIDGRSVYTPLYSGVFWDVQDALLEDLDRIEVVSGPGGTLWGANAVNGVINILSRSAKETQGWLLTGGGGSVRRDFAAIRYGGRIGGRGHFRVYGKYFDHDASRLPDGRNAGDDWRMGQGGFRADWASGGRDAFTLQGDGYGGSIDQPTGFDVRVNGGNLLGRWTRTLSENSGFKVQLYYDRTHRDIPQLFREDLATFDLDFQHRFPLGRRHDAVWGLGARRSADHVGNSAILAFLPPDLTTKLFTGFVQDEIALRGGRAAVALGVKLEHNDFSGFEWQPGVRFSTRVGERQLAWAAVSRAVRTPSRIDRDFYIPPLPGLPGGLAGGPNFDSEKLLAYELGHRLRAGGRFSLSTALFYHDYDDLRSLELTTPAVFANGLRGASRGLELAGDFQATPGWRLHGGYTWLRMSLHPKPGSTDRSSAAQVGDSPRHQAQLRSILDLGAAFELDAVVRYTDALPRQRVPAYWSADAHLAWRPRVGLEFALLGQNLLEPQHAEFGLPATRREIPRGVQGRLTWRF